MKYFETVFLKEAEDFVATLDVKTIKKVLYNIDIAEQTKDPKLLKKLEREIWEFRTKYLGLQIRLLAFWDKDGSEETLVLATHGFVKKSEKVPKKEIDKAITIRTGYFEQKKKNK
ncbi:Phage-related protein [Belliella buryatensis]|uniref:Phage-related protein n=1 Tax=Belliella buryatensis TaxID=1500549 RepID=A0A239AJL7_9BACT|nr:type II toxin-antitoxin system RelE/ParE family toxin [Belliella buryatensis]SNR95866.1 Phage-related protein [Belliella buryatensis]